MANHAALRHAPACSVVASSAALATAGGKSGKSGALLPDRPVFELCDACVTPIMAVRVLSIALLAAVVLVGMLLTEEASALRAERFHRKKGHKKDHLKLALQHYLSNTELTEWLQAFEKRCKPIARLHQIGSSTEGRWDRVCRQCWGAGDLLPPPPPLAPDRFLGVQSPAAPVPTASHQLNELGASTPAGRCGPWRSATGRARRRRSRPSSTWATFTATSQRGARSRWRWPSGCAPTTTRAAATPAPSASCRACTSGWYPA